MIVAIKIPNALTLDQLMAEISGHIEPGPYMINSCGSPVIERDHQLVKGGILRASWNSRLIDIPPLDGVTPRGPSEYYNLKFYPLPNQ